MSIRRATAEKFALAINDIRPSWDVPGIRAAFERASVAFRNATDSELLRAAINLAENGQINTPALLAEPGPWWDTAAPGNTRPTWVAHRVACGAHPQHPLGDCPICKAENGPEVTQREQIAANAAECRRAAKERMDQAAAERRAIAERQNGATP
jgi:hypothetical protein